MRTPNALVPYALMLAIVAAGALWRLGDEVALSPRAAGQGEAMVGGAFSLVDAGGGRVTDADFRGRFMLVFFGFTYCPDVCPTALAVIAAALDRLGDKAGRVVPIFVSVDPERDSPVAVGEYVASFGARFVGLTGSAQDIAVAAKAYRVYYKKRAIEGGSYTVDHSSVIYLMGPDGKYVTHFAAEMGPDAMADAIAERL